MLHLTVAGALGPLAEAVADVLREPLDDPFTPELVVVPSAGVRSWLRARLAERLGATDRGADGIAANLDLVFPGELVGRVLADDPGFGSWAVGPLTWAVHEVLVERGTELGQSADALRARAIADLFDRYALHRPAMVRAWSQGRDVGATGRPIDEHQRWQPALWRAVQEHLGGPTDAQRLADRAAALRAASSVDVGLAEIPDRVVLFGLSSLPPAHLDLLGALSRRRAVHVLAPTASAQRWHAVRDRLRSPLALPLLRTDALVPDAPGHLLITGWGRTSREADLLLLDLAEQAEGRVAAPDLPAPLADDAPVLARVQHGLRADVAPPRPAAVGTDAHAADGERPALAPDDRTISWHRTYGPARQVEVLRDVLLHLFEERAGDGSPRFEPRDVTVLCADPARFAPLVEAAFAGDAVHGVPQVPVQLADRSLRRDNALLDTAASLLDLLDGRFRASSVLAFASKPPVRHRFGLDGGALDRIYEWVEATNVRWGLDADGQRGFGLPADLDGVHTWRAGLDQLLLGVTMTAGPPRLGLGDVVPYADVEGADVTIAGALAELVQRLGTAVSALGTAQPVGAWCEALTAALVSLCSVADDDAWQWRRVERVLEELAAEATIDGQPRGRPVEPAALAALVRARLVGSPGRTRFGTGAVTLSSLSAQRGVPYRVVCLLGLDDDVAAGGLAVAEDLVAAEPCVGDADPRSEQRAQLLDAVLAAGERLIVCSTGRDLRTNAEVPPPVALSELFDVVDATVRPPARSPDGSRARDVLTTDHPRQGWSERAFRVGALGLTGPWSFDAGALAAARARREQAPTPHRLPEPLPLRPAGREPDPTAASLVALADLADACTRPAKVLLRDRLGISLPDEAGAAVDHIPLRLVGLDRWKVTRALLDARLAAANERDGDGRTGEEDRWERAERSRGGLPPLAFGDAAVAEARERVGRLLTVLAAELAGTAHDPVPVPVSIEVDEPGGRSLVVEGQVPGICGDVVVTVTPSSLKDKDLLIAWVRLAALTAAEPGRPWRAVTVGGRDNKIAVQRVQLRDAAAAAEVLAVAADLYRRANRDAVPFFPATSRALFRDGLAKARTQWDTRYGDAEDTWNQWLFPRDFDALLRLPTRTDEAVGGSATTRLGYWAERIWGAVGRTAEVEELPDAARAVAEVAT